MKQYWNF